MIEFSEAVEKAFNELQLTETISILNLDEVRKLKFIKYGQVWRLETVIFDPDNNANAITFLLAFPHDFPFVLPRIYLAEEDYNRIKYIPHVDVNRYICLFDEESIILDSEQPHLIVQSCLNQAKNIIENGLTKQNISDFDDEFLAYWKDQYNPKDHIIPCLTVIPSSTELPQFLKIFYLKKPFLRYSMILYSEDHQIESLKSFLIDAKYDGAEEEVFYLGEMNAFEPPYFYLNINIHSLIHDKFQESEKAFTTFINRSRTAKIIVFSKLINKKRLFFGWKLNPLNLHRNGFREGMLTPLQVFKTFQSKDPVVRLNFEEFTIDRLQQRTDGPVPQNQNLTLTFAGLGSIGSNVLHHLLVSGINNINLIDPDYLTLENINRHLLGFEYLHQYKSSALKYYLQLKNPLLNVKDYESSVIQIIKTDIGVLNSADFIFIAIGKYNVEEYIFNCLQNGLITKPVFFFWVEPFLCGGHCLFVLPDHRINFSDLYNGGLYKQNILDDSEYKDQSRKLLFREAGCQTSYMPFSQKNILLFLSSLIPHVFKIIEEVPFQNLKFTWKGNKDAVENNHLKLSQFSQNIQFENLIIEELI